jgi:hypothetical protein
LLLTTNSGDLVAIKTGFASGYNGEGPRRFSYVLAILDAYEIEIEEYDVKGSLLTRVDNSALEKSDLDVIKNTRPVRGARWRDYVYLEHEDPKQWDALWQEFPPAIPFGIIDSRIIDLAISFWENPDDKIFTGYRRLEDIVRERIGSKEHGAELFSRAFLGSPPQLGWKDIHNGSEQAGRANLFKDAYLAYRNPRGHREPKQGHQARQNLREFLLLNHLYTLEKEAIPMEVAESKTL